KRVRIPRDARDDRRGPLNIDVVRSLGHQADARKRQHDGQTERTEWSVHKRPPAPFTLLAWAGAVCSEKDFRYTWSRENRDLSARAMEDAPRDERAVRHRRERHLAAYDE